MAIHRMLEYSAFDPHEIKMIIRAYEDTLSALELPKGESPVAEIVAKKIIEIVQTGERDPARVSAQAIAELGIPRAA
jgi:hypothetical protein